MTYLTRRTLIAGLTASSGLALLPSAARAQLGLGGLGLSSILGKATDSALDKLAQPGAFYDDEDIRVGLPIVGAELDKLFARELDAAGIAAGEAKPSFREAIDNLSFSDAPDIIKQDDGGTQYLRRSSNDALHAKLQPLVDNALESLGVYSTFDSLAEKHSFIRRAGLDRESINTSVTDQGLDGIFSYIGNEEREFRKDPIGGVTKSLGDLFDR